MVVPFTPSSPKSRPRGREDLPRSGHPSPAGRRCGVDPVRRGGAGSALVGGRGTEALYRRVCAFCEGPRIRDASQEQDELDKRLLRYQRCEHRFRGLHRAPPIGRLITVSMQHRNRGELRGGVRCRRTQLRISPARPPSTRRAPTPRAQAEAAASTGVTIPATAAVDLPDGVDAADGAVGRDVPVGRVRRVAGCPAARCCASPTPTATRACSCWRSQRRASTGRATERGRHRQGAVAGLPRRGRACCCRTWAGC